MPAIDQPDFVAMELADQFTLALEFMLLGMGTVFTFLALLVLVVKVTGALVQRIERPDTTALNQPAEGAAATAPDEAVTAVISAAVHQYRRDFVRRHG